MNAAKIKQGLWNQQSARGAVRLIAGERSGKLTFNLDQQSGDMPVYREAIFRLTSLLVTLLLLFYAVAYLFLGDSVLALSLAAACPPLLWHCWRLFRRDKPGINPLVLMSACTVGLLLTIYFNNPANIYWVPALLVLINFVLSRTAAISLSLLCYGIVVPATVDFLPLQQATTLLLSMAVVGGGAWVFSLLVSRQDLLLQKVAVQDPLTGAYNRRYLMESLDQTFELHRRYHKNSSLIMLDIDFFKAINDDFGHSEGDRVLKQIVHLMQRRLRRTDSLFRYGGEEFVILLNETECSQAGALAEDFCTLVRSAPILPDRPISISCGVAELSQGENPLGWLARCDEALYRAKNNGRDRVELA